MTHLLKYPPVLVVTLALLAPAADACAEAPSDLGIAASRAPIEATNDLSAEQWKQLRVAHRETLRQVKQSPLGFMANNPAQSMTAAFDQAGPLIRPPGGEWSWGLTLESWGTAEGARTRSHAPQMSAEGTMLIYAHGRGLDEWWDNGPTGFEHGFTLHERPRKVSTTRAGDLGLRVDLRIRGGLTPDVLEDRRTVSFLSSSGQPQLRYSGLVAFDATGRLLDTWMTADGDRLSIHVNDQGATYPLTIDPVVQSGTQGTLVTAENADNIDYFAWAVAASGNTLVVGAQREDSDSTVVDMAPLDPTNTDNAGALLGSGALCGSYYDHDAGAAYVYVRNGPDWVLEAYLKPSVSNQGAYFGEALAIDGDTIFVGAPEDSVTSAGAGAVYAFERTFSGQTPTWSQTALITPSNAAMGDRFGTSLAYANGKLAVGAPERDGSGTNQSEAGAVYLFDYTGGGGVSAPTILTAPNADAGDWFGWSVAIDGSTVVVGAEREDSNATGVSATASSDNSVFQAGAAYVFENYSNFVAYLKPSDPIAMGKFGASVSIWGDRLAVGAWGATDGSAAGRGAAYVFKRDMGTWFPETRLEASDGVAQDHFGFSVALRGRVLVVGSRQVDLSSPATGPETNGAAYVFVRSELGWIEDSYLTPSTPSPRGYFGRTIAMSRGYIFVGAVATNVNTPQALCAGSVDVFPALPALPLGQNYCSAEPNSTGFPSAISALGSPFASDNYFILGCTGLPVGSFGYFLTSDTLTITTGMGPSNATLCIGGSIGRYNAAGQIQAADATGSVELAIDLTATPQPNSTVAIMAGQTWHFQRWHRDIPSSYNFSNGLMITFL